MVVKTILLRKIKEIIADLHLSICPSSENWPKIFCPHGDLRIRSGATYIGAVRITADRIRFIPEFNRYEQGINPHSFSIADPDLFNNITQVLKFWRDLARDTVHCESDRKSPITPGLPPKSTIQPALA